MIFFDDSLIYIFLRTFLPQFYSIIAPPPPPYCVFLLLAPRLIFMFLPLSCVCKNDALWCVCVQGAWKWSDGTALDYTHWRPGQPNGGTGENCMAKYIDQTWDDYPCGLKYYYVCKL
jgi:hypothetical protein